MDLRDSFDTSSNGFIAKNKASFGHDVLRQLPNKQKHSLAFQRFIWGWQKLFTS